MKVWITKYTLTEGIIEFDTERGDTIEVCESVDPTGNMIRVKRSPSLYPTFFHGKGREWHEDVESAYKQAQSMKDKKITSLQKQIGKLMDSILTIKIA